MAVSATMFSVIVRNSTLAEKFPGGVDGFRLRCPNATYCNDGTLSRIGFMSEFDANQFASMLAADGLTLTHKGMAMDVVVTRQDPTVVHLNLPCIWLEVGHIEGLPAVRLVGEKTELLSLAACDQAAAQDTTQFSLKDLNESHDFLGVSKRVEHYRHKATGQMIFVGRSSGPSWKINWRGVWNAFRASFFRPRSR